MKFRYEKPWTIENAAVSEADEIRIAANGKVDQILLNQSGINPNAYSISLTAMKKAIAYARKGLRTLSKARELNHFDSLVARDIRKNLNLVLDYVELEYDSNKNPKLSNVLANFFGKSAYSRILDAVRPEYYPHELLDEEAEFMYARNSRQVDVTDIFSTYSNPLFPEAVKEFNEQINKAKQAALRFYKHNQVVDNLDSIKFVFSEPDMFCSYWQDALVRAIHLDPQRILAWLDDSRKIRFDNPSLDMIAIHETGHSLQEILSERTMPKGFHSRRQNNPLFIKGVGLEGVALATEHLWFNQILLNQLQNDYDKDQIKMLDFLLRTYIPKKAVQNAHDVLELREREVNGNTNNPERIKYESHKELAKITGVKRYEDIYVLDDPDFENTLYSLSYFFGEKTFLGIIERLKKQGIDDQRILSAILTGWWSDVEAQEEFITKLLIPSMK